MSDDRTRDVAEVARRLLLDHGAARLTLTTAPSAGAVGIMGIRSRYFEITIEGRTFMFMVHEVEK